MLTRSQISLQRAIIIETAHFLDKTGNSSGILTVSFSIHVYYVYEYLSNSDSCFLMRSFLCFTVYIETMNINIGYITRGNITISYGKTLYHLRVRINFFTNHQEKWFSRPLRYKKTDVDGNL